MSEESGDEGGMKPLEDIDAGASYLEYISKVAGVTIPGLSQVATPIGAAVGAYEAGKGGWEIAEGADHGNAIEIMNGVRDTTSGVLGLGTLSEDPLMLAGSVGFSAGNMIGELIDDLTMHGDHNEYAIGDKVELPDNLQP